MRLKEIIKHASIPSGLVAVGGVFWTDSYRDWPFVGKAMSDFLANIDAHLFLETKNTSIFLVLVGLFLGWLSYFIVIFWNMGRRERARLELVRLRNDGVHLRHEGQGLGREDLVAPWVAKLGPWHIDVVNCIRRINEADAGQYATLDHPGNPRAWPSNIQNSDHQDNYVWHDRRLVLLDNLITKYGNR